MIKTARRSRFYVGKEPRAEMGVRWWEVGVRRYIIGYEPFATSSGFLRGEEAYSEPPFANKAPKR